MVNKQKVNKKHHPLSMIRLYKLAHQYAQTKPNSEVKETAEKIAYFLKYVFEHKEDEL